MGGRREGRASTYHRNIVEQVLKGQGHLPHRPRVNSQTGPYCNEDAEDACAPDELVHLWSMRQRNDVVGESVVAGGGGHDRGWHTPAVELSVMLHLNIGR